MDPHEAVSTAENELRELLDAVLGKAFGAEWLDQSGLSQERLQKIGERRDEEAKRRDAGIVEQRLVFYLDFPDLWTIISKRWDLLADCLGSKKEIEVYMDKLGDIRIAQAHGRDLLPAEQSLAEGISADIRNRIVLYRNKLDPVGEIFPKIESVRDSLGNVARPGKATATEITLHPGDEIRFECRGWDPESRPLEWWYCIAPNIQMMDTVADGDSFVWKVEDAHIAVRQVVTVMLRHVRPAGGHRLGSWDDEVALIYRVLPRPKPSSSGTLT